jgi:hypothetical protein
MWLIAHLGMVSAPSRGGKAKPGEINSLKMCSFWGLTPGAVCILYPYKVQTGAFKKLKGTDANAK